MLSSFGITVDARSPKILTEQITKQTAVLVLLSNQKWCLWVFAVIILDHWNEYAWSEISRGNRDRKRGLGVNRPRCRQQNLCTKVLTTFAQPSLVFDLMTHRDRAHFNFKSGPRVRDLDTKPGSYCFQWSKKEQHSYRRSWVIWTYYNNLTPSELQRIHITNDIHMERYKACDNKNYKLFTWDYLTLLH